MDQPNQNQEENFSEKDGFTKKTIEPPILDFAVREQISHTQPPLENASAEKGIKAFYRSNKIYVWAIVIGFAVIGILAYFAFKKGPLPQVKEANVEVNIDGPESAPSGGEAVYRIRVKNSDQQKLVDLELELVYPNGIQFVDSSPKPENLSGTVFKIADLLPGLEVPVTVKTKVMGNVNEQKELIAKLHYKYSNFNSEFIKESKLLLRLVASDVILELSGPTSSNNAQLLVYTIHYKNNSDQEIKNARISADFPEGFIYASATPLPDLGNNTWNIGSLAAKGEGDIVLQGNFSASGAGESKTMVAQFLVLGQNGEYYTQNSANFTTAIANLPLYVSQELEGQNADNIVKPGDQLSYSVKYQNNSTVAATGVNIIVTLNSRSLDLSSLQAEGATVNNNTLLWNASSIAKLENLAPSEQGQVSFSVKVKDPAVKDSSKNLTVSSSIKIKSNEYEGFFPGNDLTLKISSPLSLSSQLNFSTGNLPPKVGKQTVYTIKLSLSNSSNDYSEGLLTAFIPLGPSGFVAGSVSKEETTKVEFDSTTGKLVWKVGGLPAHTGKFSAPRAVEFNVKIIPSASQVSQSPNLLTDIKFTAKDSFTGKSAEITTDNLTTADLADQDSYSKGQVER